MADDITQVRWPGQATDPKGTDLGQPVVGLLHSLNMLGDETQSKATEGPGAAFRGAPTAVAIIEATATALGKWWSVAIAALGGTGAFLVGMRAYWSGVDPIVQATTIGAAAVILAATILAVTGMVRADIGARGRGAVAVYDARARVAAEFMRLTKAPVGAIGADGDGGAPKDGAHMAAMATAAVACGEEVMVFGPQGWDTIRAVRVNAGMVEVMLPPNVWVPIDNIRELQVKSGTASRGSP